VWWFIPVILAIQVVEIRRTAVGGQPGQKLPKTPSQTIKSWMWWYTSVITAIWGAQIGGSQSRLT
jgi:hypothetical protein